MPAGRRLRAGEGCGLSGTFVRALGPARAAPFPWVAPAVAALGPGQSRRPAGATSGSAGGGRGVPGVKMAPGRGRQSRARRVRGDGAAA